VPDDGTRLRGWREIWLEARPADSRERHGRQQIRLRSGAERQEGPCFGAEKVDVIHRSRPKCGKHKAANRTRHPGGRTRTSELRRRTERSHRVYDRRPTVNSSLPLRPGRRRPRKNPSRIQHMRPMFYIACGGRPVRRPRLHFPILKNRCGSLRPTEGLATQVAQQRSVQRDSRATPGPPTANGSPQRVPAAQSAALASGPRRGDGRKATPERISEALANGFCSGVRSERKIVPVLRVDASQENRLQPIRISTCAT